MSNTTKTRKILSLKSAPRRDFLRAGTLAVTGAALSPFLQACVQLDRLIVGDGSDETQSVMILGGGISGLTAARELKKRGVPFRIFEGSQKVGGRVFTLDEFNEASQSVDLGAEWISTNDEFVLSLCRELKVGTNTLSALSRSPQFYKGETLESFEALVKSLKLADRKILEKKDHRSEDQWDAMTAEDLLTELRSSVEEKCLLWIRRMIQLEWGTDPANISALAVLERFRGVPSGWQNATEKRVRIRGGVQNLSQALYDKIAGVVPGRFVLFDHKLVAIKDKGDRLKMDFETKDGTFSIDARVVICTLPFSTLRQVNGIENLDFSPIKLKSIQELGYGTHGKVALSFVEKFWQTKSPIWTGDLKSQWLWESGVDASSLNFGSRGIIAAQLSGIEGKNLGPHSLINLREDCKKISSSAGSEELSQMMNWSLNPWSQGSVSFFRQGQMQSFSSTLMASERQGTFIFAGEHTSLNSMGTLNGAVESGLRAALEASRFKNELSRKMI